MKKTTRGLSRAAAAGGLAVLVLALSSCTTWEQLWTRFAPELSEEDRELLYDETEPATEAETFIETEPGTEPAKETEPDTQPETAPETEGESESEPEDAFASEFRTDLSYTFDANTYHEGVNIHYAAAEDAPNAGRCVVIDAGHQLTLNSGREPRWPGSTETNIKVAQGATGEFTGQYEYELNLRVALQLRNELISRGYSVVMVRETNDVDISNAARARLANAYAEVYDEVILIRLHANSYKDADRAGALTVCQTENNPYADCAAQFTASKNLSWKILSGYCATSGITLRENAWRLSGDDLASVNWCTVPATLLEMGYLSNEGDDTAMADPEFPAKAATGIANGVDAYFA